MSLDSEIVEEIAAELGVNPAFVEKDWYCVQVLAAISAQQSDTTTTIFSGGTSLSKGYGLIQRFSEDLDFRCQYNNKNSGSQNKKIRSSYRTSVLASIETIDSIKLDENRVEKAGNYIKFPLDYPQYYTGHSALRPTLEVEFSFTQLRLNPEPRIIQSLISKFTNADPETTILCLSPIETAADKLSALTWRVIKRNREDQNDDPAMIRHLHDLSALAAVVEAEQELFVETALSSFEEDQKTGKRKTDKEFYQSMLCDLDKLKKDTEYHREYSQFVDAMSYADDKNNIGFGSALDSYEELIALFK